MTAEDQPEFDAFVAARYPSLVRSAYLLTGDRGHAEDLVQSTLLRAFPAWRQGPPANPEAYVRTAMVRLALRWRRRKWTGEIPTQELPELVHDGPGIELRMALQAALRELSVEHRAVLVLRHLAGLSEAETAEVLGCSVGTVKSRSSRGLAALRTNGLLDQKEDV
jgi:RNA polymerase sigma-70 factor (sigma-E family)